jgi:ABC-2 type transport system ATP-binding protein
LSSTVPASSPIPVIKTVALTRRFGPIEAVRELTLEVPAGAVFGFLGPNGAGKTTTLRMLLGLLEPSSGEASVLGFDPRSKGREVRRAAGVVLEYPGLYEPLSVEDNLELAARIWRLPVALRHSRIDGVLSQFGLLDRRHSAVRELSRGLQQRVAIARALLHDPRLLFLDEPTAGLDPVAASALREDIASLAREHGVTIFLTTHNLTEAEKLCDLVGVIREGRLLALGHPGTLHAQKSQEFRITGRGINEAVAQLLREQPGISAAVDGRDLKVSVDGRGEISSLIPILIDAGVAVEEVKRVGIPLEEEFLALMRESEATR